MVALIKLGGAFFILVWHVILSCCFVKTRNYENSSQACCLVGRLICAFSEKVDIFTCWNLKTYPLPNAEYAAQKGKDGENFYNNWKK